MVSLRFWVASILLLATQCFAQTDSSIYRAAVWNQVQDGSSWTDTVIDGVTSLLSDFEEASDVEDFCPGYARSTSDHKLSCWLRLVGAVAHFESDFDPGESFLESDGNSSIGLLSLSPNECSNAPTAAELKDPLANLECGTQKMASLIARDHYISGPDGQRGAAQYWSTLREPYQDGKYSVGKKAQVIQITTKYDFY